MRLLGRSVWDLASISDTSLSITGGQSFSISENVSDGDSIGSVATTGDSATGFSLISGNSNSAFAISSSGAITVNASSAIDYETVNSYTLGVRATDGTNTVDETLSVTISDVPLNISGGQSFTISEGASNGDTIGTIAITGDMPKSFSISAGNIENAFSINSNGTLFLNNRSALNLMADFSLNIEVEVSDGSSSKQETVTIDYTFIDRIPVINLDSDNSTSNQMCDFQCVWTEDKGPVTATDSDAVIIDPDSTHLTMLLVKLTNPLDQETEVLTVDLTGTQISSDFDSASTSLILSGTDTIDAYNRVLKTIAYNNSTDHPSTDQRKLSFQVSDGTHTSAIATTHISVTAVNDPPIITPDMGDNPTLIKMDENKQAVITIPAEDPDLPNDQLVYSISGGVDKVLFHMESESGELSFVSAPDYENPSDSDRNNDYHVSVRVMDQSGLADTQNYIVTVNDTNDVAPKILSKQLFNISGGLKGGSLIGTIRAKDPDTIGKLQNWRITKTDNKATYAIDSESGRLTVLDDAYVKNVSGIHLLGIQVSDGTYISSIQDVIIKVNEAHSHIVFPDDPPEIPPETEIEPEPEDFSEKEPVDPDPGSSRPDDSWVDPSPEEDSLPVVEPLEEIWTPPEIPSETADDFHAFPEDTESFEASVSNTQTLQRNDNSEKNPYRPDANVIQSQVANRSISNKKSSHHLSDPNDFPAFVSAIEDTIAFYESEVRPSRINQQLSVQAAQVGGVTLSLGLVFWILRVSNLLVWLLGSLPMWRFYDPLPVLDMTRKEKSERDKKEERMDYDENDIELFLESEEIKEKEEDK